MARHRRTGRGSQEWIIRTTVKSNNHQGSWKVLIDVVITTAKRDIKATISNHRSTGQSTWGITGMDPSVILKNTKQDRPYTE